MSRSVELSGRALLVVFEVVSLVALVVFVGPAIWPPEDAAGVALVSVFVLVVVGLVAAMWHSRRVDASYLRSGYDISDDPIAPGQAAKERWGKAVSRLPDEEDEEEEKSD